MSGPGSADKPFRDLVDIIHFTENLSAQIHGLLDEDEIYSTVIGEFAKSRRYNASILLLDREGSGLRIVETSTPSRVRRLGEKLSGVRLKTYKIDLSKSGIYSRVVKEGKTLQVCVGEIIAELFPRPLAYTIAKATGYSRKPAILTPLSRHGTIIGALAMSSTELSSHLVPSVTSLARHVSAALELADEAGERRRVEQELRENEARFRSLFESSPDPIALVDVDMNILDCNQATLRTFGCSAKHELIGRNAREFLDTEGQKKMARHVRRTLKSGAARDVEFSLLAEDGHTLDVAISASVMRDSAGRPTAFVAVLQDIGDRKRSQEALRESEQRYRSLVENMPVVIYSLDRTGRIVSVNRAMKTLFGFEPDEVIGRDITEFVPEAALSVVDASRRQVLAGRKLTTETTVIDKKGVSHAIEFSAVPVIRDGKIVGSQGIVRDISEQKRAEQELRRSHEQLRELSKYIQSAREEERVEVARRIHDELGQTCTVLKMDLAWLKGKLPAAQHALRKKANSMLALIDTAIKTVRRITAELRPTVLDDLGLGAAIEWEAKEFQNRTGIACEATLIPEDIVAGKDVSVAFYRIFQEALSNAARHSNATKIETSLIRRDGSLELEIRDNGVGITQKQMSDTRAFGLIGMRERAHSCGGELNIRGAKNKGTILTATVPLGKQGENHDQSADSGRSRRRPQGTEADPC